MKELKTDRLLLRSIEERDAEQLFQWENDLNAWTSSMTLNPLSHKFIKDYITYSNQSILENGELVLFAENLDTQEAVGYLQFLNYEPLHQKVAIGIYVSKSCRNLGYAGEMLDFAKTYAFDILHCRMLYAETLKSNSIACRLFERQGFEQTAVLPNWYWVNGGYKSLVYYQVWS